MKDKSYQVKVKYIGYSGQTYDEELNFTKEAEAVHAYDIFANDVSGFVQSVSFKTIDK